MLPTYKSGLLQTKAYRILRTTVNNSLSQFDISMTQWSILGLIFENKNIRFSELANHMAVEAPLVSTVVEELKRKRLVKIKNDAQDARVKLLELTKKGEQLVPKIEKRLFDSMKNLLSTLSPKEVETYFKVLKIISEQKS